MRALGDDAIHQPDFFSVTGVDHSCGHNQLFRARIADRPRKPRRAADVGHEADAHFGHPEPRAHRRDSRIACERELEAESADEAVQRADDRLLDTLDPVQRPLRLRHEAPKALHVGAATVTALRAGVVGEGSEIDARRERLSLAVNDDRANLGTIDLVDRVGNRAEHRLVNRVALLRPVERNIRDLTVDSNLDWIFRHVRLLAIHTISGGFGFATLPSVVSFRQTKFFCRKGVARFRASRTSMGHPDPYLTRSTENRPASG